MRLKGEHETLHHSPFPMFFCYLIALTQEIPEQAQG